VEIGTGWEEVEKRKAKSEKRKAKSEKRKAKSEKRKAKSEKRKAKSEKRDQLNVNVLPRSLRYASQKARRSGRDDSFD
jgi:uncharacterized protein (DUF3084 family)